MADIEFSPLAFGPEDFEAVKIVDALDEVVARSLGVPPGAMGVSPLCAAFRSVVFQEAAMEYAGELLGYYADAALRVIERTLLAEMFERTSLADLLAELEERRWEGYLARAFRGRPGMRFADLMRGTGRN